MYNEERDKAILAVMVAILLAIVAAYWQQAKFLFGFLWDLFVLNIQPVLQEWATSFREHWPF